LDNVSSFDEILDWYVKWGTFHYTLDMETWHEVNLQSDSSDAIDWKRPTEAAVFAVDASGDYGDNELSRR